MGTIQYCPYKEGSSICGIIGIYGKIGVSDQVSRRNFIIDATVINSLRGQDATGIAMLPASKGFVPEVYKRALSGWDFIQLATTRKLLNRIDGTSGVIVHNRLATKGDLTDGGAHPFTHDHITLVHNGVINNHYTLKDAAFSGSVDSDALAHLLSIEEPDVVLPKIEGAYSLVWWDSRDGSLHFARNGQRPMYFMYTKNKGMLLFASEYQMIWTIAARHGIQLEKDAFETSEHNHYVFCDPAKPEVFVKTPFTQSRQFQTAGNNRGRNNKGIMGQTGNQNTSQTVVGGGFQTSMMQNTSGNKVTQAVLAKELKGHIKESRIAQLVKLALGYGEVPIGATILLKPQKFVPYTNAKNKREVRGVLHAIHPRTLAPVRICNVLESSASVIVNDDYISGKIVNFQKEGNKYVFVGIPYTSIRKQTPPAEEVAVIRNSVKGPNGIDISEQKFKEYTKLDCANCFNSVTPYDADKIRWLPTFTPIQFLCPECASDSQIRAIFPEDKTSYAH